MRMPLVIVLLFFLLGALVDVVICRAVFTRCRRGVTLWRQLALYSSIFFAVCLLAMVAWPKKSATDASFAILMWFLYVYLSVYISKFIFVLLYMIACVPMLWRRKSLSWLTYSGIGMALLTFGLMWWGALINKYNIEVKDVTYTNESLPPTFDGFTIVQLSDMHVGTYGTDTTYLHQLVEKVNSLGADAVVFTGDIVNRSTTELLPFVNTLSELKATFGVFSILGNHDYGDYHSWPSPEAKQQNMALMRHLQSRMGWKMLNNESATIYAGNDSIVIIGVENIGDPPFPIYGNLDSAYPGDLADDAFKILLSHNPAHWTEDIADSPDKNIALTLSGHTHAMQIELFGLSPAVFRYKTWGGMYGDNDGHSLYVNIGIGEVGMPARMGATPEITLITLKR